MIAILFTGEICSKEPRGEWIWTEYAGKGDGQMRKNNGLARKVVKILNSYLKLEANSASSICMHQQKAPKGLERFRR